jgi:hypothetical protein
MQWNPCSVNVYGTGLSCTKLWSLLILRFLQERWLKFCSSQLQHHTVSLMDVNISEEHVLTQYSISHLWWQPNLSLIRTIHCPLLKLVWMKFPSFSFPVGDMTTFIITCLQNWANCSHCTFQPWRQRQDIPSKCSYTPERLHCVITQKIMS